MFKKIQLYDKDNIINIVPEELEEKCRTCLKRIGTINLFSTKHKEILFKEMFIMFSLPKIDGTDGLPQKICDVCAKIITEFHAFKQQIEHIEIMLNIALGKLNEVKKPIQQNNTSPQIDDIIAIDDDDDDGDDHGGDQNIHTNIEQEKIEDTNAGTNIESKQDIKDSYIPKRYVPKPYVRKPYVPKPYVPKPYVPKKTFRSNNSSQSYTCCDCTLSFNKLSDYLSHREKVREKKKKDREKEGYIESENVDQMEENIDHMEENIEHMEENVEHMEENIEHMEENVEDVDNTEINHERIQDICDDNMNKTKIEGMKDSENEHHGLIKTNYEEKKVVDNPNGFNIFLDHNYMINEQRSVALDHNYMRKTEAKKKERIYQCKFDVCDLEFTSVIEYLNHRREEQLKRLKIPCPLCNRNTPLHKMEEHKLFHERNKCFKSTMLIDPQTAELTCSICNDRFDTALAYLSHRRYKRNRIRIRKKPNAPPAQAKQVCPICGQQYNENKIKAHIKTHSKQDQYKCEVCGETFKLKAVFEAHSHFNLLCDQCGKEYKSQSRLDHHIRSWHLGIRPHFCNICDKRFIKKYQLETHLRRHTGERPYLCPECGKKFIQSAHLKKHMKNTHNPQKKFHCDICSRSFVENYRLQAHLRRHSSEKKRYSRCGICNESVIDITFHMCLHDKGHNHICGYCNEIFDEGSKLVSHKRGRTCKPAGRAVASWVCDVCGKSFNSRHWLLIHNRVHTGEKPYRCEQCGKRFIQVSHLKTHALLHTGEKNFVCPYCGKRFTLNGNLTQHVRIHTGERPFRCQICPRGFPTSSALRKHENVHTTNRGTTHRNKNKNRTSNPNDFINFEALLE